MGTQLCLLVALFRHVPLTLGTSVDYVGELPLPHLVCVVTIGRQISGHKLIR